jgi:UDP-N-acetylglucosamine 2-epimerase
LISIFLGTFPEIIKMFPIIRACNDKGLDYSILHTGQHYSYAMDRIFFEQFDLPMPSTPTKTSCQILLREGIAQEKNTAYGNTVVEAVLRNIKIAQAKVNPLEDLILEPSGYFLVTAHRTENVDDPIRLAKILDGLRNVAAQFGMLVIFPILVIAGLILNTLVLIVIDPRHYIGI